MNLPLEDQGLLPYEKLTLFLKSNGIRNSFLARKLEVSRVLVYYWSTNQRRLSPDFMRRINAAFNSEIFSATDIVPVDEKTNNLQPATPNT